MAIFAKLFALASKLMGQRLIVLNTTLKLNLIEITRIDQRRLLTIRRPHHHRRRSVERFRR